MNTCVCKCGCRYTSENPSGICDPCEVFKYHSPHEEDMCECEEDKVCKCISGAPLTDAPCECEGDCDCNKGKCECEDERVCNCDGDCKCGSGECQCACKPGGSMDTTQCENPSPEPEKQFTTPGIVAKLYELTPDKEGCHDTFYDHFMASLTGNSVNPMSFIHDFDSEYNTRPSIGINAADVIRAYIEKARTPDLDEEAERAKAVKELKRILVKPEMMKIIGVLKLATRDGKKGLYTTQIASNAQLKRNQTMFYLSDLEEIGFVDGGYFEIVPATPIKNGKAAKFYHMTPRFEQALKDLTGDDANA